MNVYYSGFISSDSGKKDRLKDESEMQDYKAEMNENQLILFSCIHLLPLFRSSIDNV